MINIIISVIIFRAKIQDCIIKLCFKRLFLRQIKHRIAGIVGDFLLNLNETWQLELLLDSPRRQQNQLAAIRVARLFVDVHAKVSVVPYEAAPRLIDGPARLIDRLGQYGILASVNLSPCLHILKVLAGSDRI